jgi:hypothetical protein
MDERLGQQTGVETNLKCRRSYNIIQKKIRNTKTNSIDFYDDCTIYMQPPTLIDRESLDTHGVGEGGAVLGDESAGDGHGLLYIYIPH